MVKRALQCTLTFLPAVIAVNNDLIACDEHGFVYSHLKQTRGIFLTHVVKIQIPDLTKVSSLVRI